MFVVSVSVYGQREGAKSKGTCHHVVDNVDIEVATYKILARTVYEISHNTQSLFIE